MTTFKDILQDLPPGEYSDIPDVVYETNKSWMSDEVLMAIRTPDLQMHCDNEKCNGVRLLSTISFRCTMNTEALKEATHPTIMPT